MYSNFKYKHHSDLQHKWIAQEAFVYFPLDRDKDEMLLHGKLSCERERLAFIISEQDASSC